MRKNREVILRVLLQEMIDKYTKPKIRLYVQPNKLGK